MEHKPPCSIPSPTRHGLFTFLAVVLAVLMSLISGEILVRLLGAHQTWTEKNRGSYVSPYAQQFPRSWVLDREPNQRLSYRQPEFDFEIRTNSEGFRDVDHIVDKPAGEYRIVVLGDSWVEGQGAEYGRGWPKRLEAQLNEIGFQKTIVVIVAGVAGNDPVFQLEGLRRRFLKYKPDMVIMAVNDSDVTDIIARGGMDRFLPDGRVKDREVPWFEPFWARIRLFRVVMMDVFGYDYLLLSRNQQAIKKKEALATIARVAETMNALGKVKGFNLIVIGHPQRNHFWFNSDYNIQALGTLLPAIGVDYVDLKPLVQSEIASDPSRISDYFWRLDGHANERGYEVYARETARAVATRIKSHLTESSN